MRTRSEGASGDHPHGGFCRRRIGRRTFSGSVFGVVKTRTQRIRHGGHYEALGPCDVMPLFLGRLHLQPFTNTMLRYTPAHVDNTLTSTWFHCITLLQWTLQCLTQLQSPSSFAGVTPWWAARSSPSPGPTRPRASSIPVANINSGARHRTPIHRTATAGRLYCQTKSPESSTNCQR